MNVSYAKTRSIIVEANTVHHVMSIEEYPELALFKTYVDKDGKERGILFHCEVDMSLKERA